MRCGQDGPEQPSHQEPVLLSAHPRLSRRTRAGFTLVELIAAIVVLALLAALAVPSFRAVIHRAHDGTARVSLQAVLRDTAALASFDGTFTWDDLQIAVDETTGKGGPFTLVADGDGDGISDGPSTGYGSISGAVSADGRTVGMCMLSATGHQLFAASPYPTPSLSWHRDSDVCLGTTDIPADATTDANDGNSAGGGTSGSASSRLVAEEIDCEWTDGGQPFCYGRNYGGRISATDSSDTYYGSRMELADAPAAAWVDASRDAIAVLGAETSTVVLRGDHDGDATTAALSTWTTVIDPATGTGAVVSSPDRFAMSAGMLVLVSDAGSVLLVGRDPVTGTVHSASSPKQLAALPAGYTAGQVVAIDCGANFTCLLFDDGTVWCLGYNDRGQLGAGIADAGPYADWQQVVDGSGAIGGVTGLALGQWSVAARTGPDATLPSGVYAWGESEAGATGDDNLTADRNTAVVVCADTGAGGCAAGDLTHVTGMYPAGPEHVCVDDASGRYLCWGRFDDGSGTATEHPVPVAMTAPVPAYPAPTDPNADQLFSSSWVAAATGGDGYVYADDVAVTSDGAIVTGSFRGRVEFGSTALDTATDKHDVFVAKVGTDGQWKWATGVGGDDTDRAFTIATDADGFAYLGGDLYSDDGTGHAPFGPYLLPKWGNTQIAYIAKISPDGVWQWATERGDDQNRGSVRDITVSDGRVWLAGHLGTSGMPTMDVVEIGPADGSWTTVASVSGNLSAHSIARGPGGEIVMTGKFKDTVSFGTHSVTSDGLYDDAFVASVGSDGAWQWALAGGGSGADSAHAVAIDGDGTVYVAGRAKSTATFGAHTITSSGSQTGLVATIAPVGGTWEWQWVATVGGDTSHAEDVKIYADGGAAVVGGFTGEATFDGDLVLATPSTRANAFMARISPTGSWAWGDRWGNNGHDRGYGVDLDAADNAVVTGYFGSTSVQLDDGSTLDRILWHNLFVTVRDAAGQKQ